MAQTLDPSPDAASAPLPPDPALLHPARPAAPPDIAPFGFAPAPSALPPATLTVSDPPAPAVSKRRRAFDWYGIAVALLMLVSAIVCVSRLIWAATP